MAGSEHQVVEHQVGKNLGPSFTLDDAFSDGEDADSNLEFTSAVLRKHLAENPTWAAVDDREDEAETDYGSAQDLDTSISTFCLDGSSNSHAESLPASPEPSDTEEHQEEAPQDFCDITLSGELSTNGHSTLDADIQEEADTPPHDTSQYPAVHIDVRNHVIASVGTEDDLKDQQEDEAAGPVFTASSPHFSVPTYDLPPIPPSPSSPLPKSPTSPTIKTRSAGPSTFQKVMSKTRPHFLPPKSRQEDRKHMADWEAMMKQSRAAGSFSGRTIVAISDLLLEEKRRKALQERRLARELKIEQSIYIWEKEILPDWRVVHKNPNLRRLWWNGIPTKLRASMWQQAVGNALALSKGGCCIYKPLSILYANRDYVSRQLQELS